MRLLAYGLLAVGSDYAASLPATRNPNQPLFLRGREVQHSWRINRSPEDLFFDFVELDDL